MDVTIVDVPAVLARAIPAAGEFGHVPMIPPIGLEGKQLKMVAQ
jgi:hypothetical protein